LEATISQAAGKSAYLALLLVALATLMLEISVTRIFSVSIGYHFAFLAISLAMFGMTTGAVIVFLAPNLFAAGKQERRLGWIAILFAFSIVLSLLLHLITPITMSPYFITSLSGVFAIAWSCFVVSMPFVFSGIFVSGILPQFVRQVPSLYAIDLLGAALACPLVIIVLNWTDGPTTILVAAMIASIASACLARGAQSKILSVVVFSWLLCLSSLLILNVQAVNKEEPPPLRLVWIKGKEDLPSHDRWNSFSRVRFMGNIYGATPPFGWGLSQKNPYRDPVHQICLDIDGSAGSVLTKMAGTNLEYLKYDVSNMVHFLRSKASVLVIGVGGGRDILSALQFDQKSVLGVELNDHILEGLNVRYGDYTGHLDRNPKTRFVNDEARSYVTRTNEKFDIIQISLIDTWAATASGVFALAENALYTVEGVDTFLNHLNDHGILSISRWYFKDPAEIYRLVSLSTAALHRIGVADSRAHLILIKSQGEPTADPIGTLLISKQAFSSDEVRIITAKAKELNFEIALSPESATDPLLEKIVTAKDWHQIASDFATKIEPPTDDCPYFFQFLKPEHILRPDQWTSHASLIVALFIVMIVLLLMLVICVFIPLIVVRTGHVLVRGTGHLYAYFTCIGVGFMLMEMSMMQRLTVFLGHPIYGLSVVLFSLLLASGMGSYLTESLDKKGILCSVSARMFILFAVFVGVGIASPVVFEQYQGAETNIRILSAVALLTPLGLVAGMAFPSGFKLAVKRAAAIAPWLWAINGGASVLAASLAMLISINFGTNATYWLASVCYLIAGATMLKEGNTNLEDSKSTTA
jgi:hypothetical protein